MNKTFSESVKYIWFSFVVEDSFQKSLIFYSGDSNVWNIIHIWNSYESIGFKKSILEFGGKLAKVEMGFAN